MKTPRRRKARRLLPAPEDSAPELENTLIPVISGDQPAPPAPAVPLAPPAPTPSTTSAPTASAAPAPTAPASSSSRSESPKPQVIRTSVGDLFAAAKPEPTPTGEQAATGEQTPKAKQSQKKRTGDEKRPRAKERPQLSGQPAGHSGQPPAPAAEHREQPVPAELPASVAPAPMAPPMPPPAPPAPPANVAPPAPSAPVEHDPELLELDESQTKKPLAPPTAPVVPAGHDQVSATETTEFRLQWGWHTDHGPRPHNEDSATAQVPLFAIADGMGGHASGELASALALKTLAAELAGQRVNTEEMRQAIVQAEAAVKTLETPKSAPGCTLTGVALAEQAGLPCWLVFNIGDSRTYRVANGVMEQLTKDHSEVQEMVDQGLMTADQAQVSGKRNVITKALGGGMSITVTPDIWVLPAHSWDRIIICTDGLTEAVPNTHIAHFATTIAAPAELAQMLVTQALRSGTRDNTTVLVVDTVAVQPDSVTIAANDDLDDTTMNRNETTKPIRRIGRHMRQESADD